MKILFLVGNGFDKNLGMKTSFSDFYEYYFTIESKDERIINFKKALEKNKEDNWADLEIALGEYSANLTNIDDYEYILRDVVNNLADYLQEEEKKYNYENANAPFLNMEFRNFIRYFSNFGKEKFMSFCSLDNNDNINIINFNYTRTIEKIISRTLPMEIGNHIYKGTKRSHVINSIIHIHGTIDYTMILGVNDDSQIKNEKMRTDRVMNMLVKPRLNNNAMTLRERECENLILNANIIVIYGMSIGKTDKCWWEKIMHKFIKDPTTLIVVVNYDSEIKERTKHLDIHKYEHYKDLLYSYIPDIDEEDKRLSRDRILVELNTNMFKFGVEAIENVVKNK